jgi:regulator of protease activity HflC (stomatin/prohibitin superfamily)
VEGIVQDAFIVVWLLLLVLFVVIVFSGVKTVPQGQNWTVERFGAFTRLLHPGLNFLMPFVDRVGRKLNVQEQVLDIPEQSVITGDNATVSVDGVIYYRVMDAAKAAYQVASLGQALSTLAMTNIRAVIGEMALDAALSSRERINTQLLTILDGATEPWGVKVSRVEIRKIEPPENLIRAMNLQMTAERERRATVTKADGDREASIMRAEGLKQSQVLAAEGRQQAAEKDAQARERLAAAEAMATRSVAEAARDGGEAALRYFISDRYIQAFQAIAASPNTRLVVVPMEAAGIAGGIVQALELIKPATAPLVAPTPASAVAGPARAASSVIPATPGSVPPTP